MNGTCSTKGKMLFRILVGESLEEGERFEGLCVGGEIILNGY
jgi:hypothetical protein